MNYLAHFKLSKPDIHSIVGNMMGDFRRFTELSTLPRSILDGIENHQRVDKFTDGHAVVNDLKSCLHKCSEVLLATDEDREGEMIAWSIVYILKLKDAKRIIFNSIFSTSSEFLYGDNSICFPIGMMACSMRHITRLLNNSNSKKQPFL